MKIENKINNLPQELKLTIYNYFVYKPKNKDELRNAVKEWCNDKKKLLKNINIFLYGTFMILLI